MATNIGTGPEDIPLNQHLGQMAYLDEPPRAKCYVAVVTENINEDKSYMIKVHLWFCIPDELL